MMIMMFILVMYMKVFARNRAMFYSVQESCTSKNWRKKIWHMLMKCVLVSYYYYS